MREITMHKVNEVNDGLTIRAVDNPGAGGANHEYVIEVKDAATQSISFQNGPVKEAGVNGTTHEALIAILIDRLQAFQSGPYACAENKFALDGLIQAQYWMNSRTKTREQRGVEGTWQV